MDFRLFVQGLRKLPAALGYLSIALCVLRDLDRQLIIMGIFSVWLAWNIVDIRIVTGIPWHRDFKKARSDRVSAVQDDPSSFGIVESPGAVLILKRNVKRVSVIADPPEFAHFYCCQELFAREVPQRSNNFVEVPFREDVYRHGKVEHGILSAEPLLSVHLIETNSD